MNFSEVMEFYEFNNLDMKLPDWYIPLEKISAFSRYSEKQTVIHVQGMDSPIMVEGVMDNLVDIYDMKIKNIMHD